MQTGSEVKLEVAVEVAADVVEGGFKVEVFLLDARFGLASTLFVVRRRYIS